MHSLARRTYYVYCELDDADFAKYDVSSLRTGVIAGSTCPRELMKRLTTIWILQES